MTKVINNDADYFGYFSCELLGSEGQLLKEVKTFLVVYRTQVISIHILLPAHVLHCLH